MSDGESGHLNADKGILDSGCKIVGRVSFYIVRNSSEPDEDGFITVTRGGRQGPAREEEARAKEEELKKREKNRVKDDFYRFQQREKKKELAKDLVKGFEEDQRRVEEMKRRRGKIRPE